MELKEATYKTTELGLIPEDWSVLRLGDVVKLKNGYAFSSEFFGERGPIVMTPGNFKIEGGLNFDEQKLIRFSGSYTNDMTLQEGDLVLVMTDLTPGCNLLGKSGIVNGDRIILHNQRIGKIIIKANSIDKYFLSYYFNSTAFSARMKGTATGSTVRHTSVPTINDTILAVPNSLNEQKAIATALSDVDTLITNLDKLIAKKKAIKQGAMQQLLKSPAQGGQRLPGFEGEWKCEVVHKIMKVFRGGSPRPIQAFLTTASNGVNWIKIGDTEKNGKYITSCEEKIIPEGESNSRKVNVGDFLLSNSMSFGRPYILKIDGCIHDGWLVLQEYQKHLDTEFLYYLLTSRQVLNQYLSKAAGSGVLNLNKDLVNSVELEFPKSIKEQKAIASILFDMDKEIESLERKKSKYIRIKQGMMQELLTGKTRLNH